MATETAVTNLKNFLREFEQEVPAEVYRDICKALGETLIAKDKAYGRAWLRVGEFLKLLWPNGVPPEQYIDMLLVVRVFDKLSRIATDKGAFNEDAWRDLAGYGVLGASRKTSRGDLDSKKSRVAARVRGAR